MKSLLVAIACALLAGVGAAQAPAVHGATGDATSDNPLAGNLELHDAAGKVKRLSELRGTPVILNFWATWCPPCRREIPWLVGIQKKYGSQGIQVVGVSVDDDGASAVASVVAETHINYLLLFGDLDSTLSYIGAQGLPVTLFIGRDGVVRHKTLGAVTEEELEKNAKELLK